MTHPLFKPSRPIERWPHPACLPEEDLLRSCDLGRGRSSGPGGQHRNKVETLVIVTHRPTGISAQAGERRSQAENRHVALRRLRLALATRVRTAVPAGEVGSALWRSRVRAGRIACNPAHHDYPSLLAEAMDVLAAAGWEPRKAALRLEVTPTQLLRLIADHPAALAQVNEARAAAHLHRLR